jgi:hypothetical protein
MASRIPGAIPWAVDINASFPYLDIREEGAFRILKLLPGEGNSPIKCELMGVNIAEVPLFEAFSYVWGDGLDCTGISIDGNMFAVKLNLFFALAFLRLRLSARFLWVDAICINQNDIEERSSQVQMMRDIYGSAIRTYVWLGLGDSWTYRALEFLPRLAEVLETPEDKEVEVLDSLLLKEDFVHGMLAVAYLLVNSWFSRVWVIQEVAVAKMATVFLGSETIEAGTKSTCITNLSRLCGPAFQGIFFRALKRKHKFDEKTIQIIEGLNQNIINHLMILPVANGSLNPTAERMPITSLLVYTRTYKSTDPRDRVFAWHRIAKDLNHIKPDYTKSVGEVYAAVVKGSFLSRDPWSLSELRWIGALEKSPIEEIPSWVPDYHKLGRHRLGFLYSAAYNPGGSAPTPIYNIVLTDDPNYKVLHLPGIKIDTIKVLSSPEPTNDSMKNSGVAIMRQFISEWKTVASASRTDLYPTGGTRWEAFWKTILADLAVSQLHKGGAPDSTQRINLLRDQNVDASARRLRDDDIYVPPLTGSEEEMLTAAFEHYSPPFIGHKLCVTERNLLVLSTPFAEVGDVACMFLGGNPLYVIRPIEDGFYMFVGECYVHGFMDGEIIKEVEAGRSTFEEFKLK